MPGTINPFSLASIGHMLDRANSVSRDVASVADQAIRYVDLRIHFIGASGLPKMDVVGSADPYFVAKLDEKISFVSTVKADTLAPVWNEWWHINNVPTHAILHVSVLDKDDGVTDDFIGKFTTTVSQGAKEVEIESPILKRTRGTMWLKIDSTPSASPAPESYPYVFDGPVRFSRHFCPTVGRLTHSDMRLYSTWKFFLKGVPLFLGDTLQHWNRNYKGAQSIFAGPASFAVRSGIQATHRMLYARRPTNVFGVINTREDALHVLRGGAGVHEHRVKPTVYTYIISAEDDSFRFSETGAAFFVDYASKHALQSNCAAAVRYGGEFHPRPAGGWAGFSEGVRDDEVRWELVVDNNSGTYAPDAGALPGVKALLEYNFPGFGIFAMGQDDPELARSQEACRAYALAHREPHVGKDEAIEG